MDLSLLGMTRISNIPLGQRPREKALHQGIENLSDAELLAILISTGTKEKSALDLAYDLLDRFGSFDGLQRVKMDELLKIRGIREAKASIIVATFEILRRFEKEIKQEKTQVLCFEDALKVLVPKSVGVEQEKVFLLLLNDLNELLRVETLFVGTKEAVICSPKDILKAILRTGASKVYIGHNHPSGCPFASSSDIETTNTLFYFLATCGITLVDSLVIGEKESYALMEKRKINNEMILKF